MDVFEHMIIEVSEEDVDEHGFVKFVKGILVELPVEIDNEYLALVKFSGLLLVLFLSRAEWRSVLNPSPARALL